MSNLKTYEELIKFPTFIERFRYLKLNGRVGETTFGFDRYLNQIFYKTKEWKDIRREVIVRDCGCDLGIDDRLISGQVYIHHMNPIAVNDIMNRSEILLNPNYLISVSYYTHQAIHYGDESLLYSEFVERRPNDTIPWRQ